MVDHSGRQLYRNTLMTDFAWASENDRNISVHCCATRSVHWLVRLCRPIVQSHMTFLNAHAEFIRKMHFHLPLLALTLFCTSQNPPQTRVSFLRIKKFGISITRFWCNKMRIKRGWCKQSWLLYVLYRPLEYWRLLPMFQRNSTRCVCLIWQNVGSWRLCLHTSLKYVIWP